LTEDLKLPREWEAIDRIKIIDPDGWSRGSYRSWGEPISYAEWTERMNQSTCDFSNWGK